MSNKIHFSFFQTQKVQVSAMESVVHAYLRHPDGSLWAHQIQSYEHFMKEGLSQIIHYRPTIVVKSTSSARSIEIKFGRVTILDPCVREQDGQTRKLTPIEARTRKMTYQVGVAADVHQKITDADGNVVNKFKNKTAMIGINVARYFAMVLLYGGIVTVVVGLFVMTPETANGRGSLPVVSDVAAKPPGLN